MVICYSHNVKPIQTCFRGNKNEDLSIIYYVPGPEQDYKVSDWES